MISLAINSSETHRSHRRRSTILPSYRQPFRKPAEHLHRGCAKPDSPEISYRYRNINLNALEGIVSSSSILAGPEGTGAEGSRLWWPQLLQPPTCYFRTRASCIRMHLPINSACSFNRATMTLLAIFWLTTCLTTLLLRKPSLHAC